MNQRSFRAFYLRSIAHSQEASYDLDHGLDPTGEVESAIADGARAAELQPGLPGVLTAQVAALSVRGSYESGAGIDPSATFETAIALATRAVEGDPDNSYSWGNDLIALTKLAEYRSSCGVDPAALAAPVKQGFEGCVRSDPVGDDCYRFDGAFHLIVAEHALATHQDASAELAVADAELHKACALVPGLDSGPDRERVAEVNLVRLLMAGHDSRDRKQALDLFTTSIADCYRVAAEDAACARLEAEGALAVARRDGRHDLLARAGRLASRAVERNPRGADAHAVLAETELELARSASSAERQRHIAAGLAACARGLAVHPRHLRLRDAQAELERLRATIVSRD